MTATIELTKTQRESVEYDAGDLLVKGVPGSGKSIVLMQRALRFNKKAIEEGQTKRILILAYTNSLVKYTEELVDLSGLAPRMIEISTVNSLCLALFRKMSKQKFVRIIEKQAERENLVNTAIQRHLEKTKKKHRFHDVEAAFWAEEFAWIKQKNIVTQEEYLNAERIGRGGKIRMAREDRPVAYELFQEYCRQLKKSHKYEWADICAYLIKNADGIPETEKYDHILVDEAQDLSYVQLKAAKLLTRQTITIAADKAQKIYTTTFSWKELGIDIRGRASKALEKTFRSTKQIVQLSESLLEVNRAQEENQNEYTDPVLPEREGTTPRIISCKTAMDERDIVLTLAEKHVSKRDVVGILYRSYAELIPLEKWLKTARIAYEKISKDGGWSLNRPGVKLSTFHSAKGLEFDVIIIPMFTESSLPFYLLLKDADLEQLEEVKAQERSLLYVGMTRAKYDLYFTFSGNPSYYLEEFEPDFYEYTSNDGTPLPKPKCRQSFTQPGDQTSTQEESSDTVAEGLIRNGAVVWAHKAGEKKVRKYIIDANRFPAQVPFLDHKCGDTVVMLGKTYVIDAIE